MRHWLVLCGLLVVVLAGCRAGARSQATPTWTRAPTARNLSGGGGDTETSLPASSPPSPSIATTAPLPTLALILLPTPTPPLVSTLVPLPSATTMAIPSFTPPPTINPILPLGLSAGGSLAR